MSEPSLDLRRTERQFARSVIGGIVLLGLVAVLGPVLSYRGEAGEIRTQFRTRVAREARVYAEDIGLHLQLLRSELVRVGAGVSSDLSVVPIEDFEDLFNPELGIFRRGMFLLDSGGRVRWGEPAGVVETSADMRTRGWFQRLLGQNQPVIDAIEPGSSTFVVAVPIGRGERTVAVLAGLLDAGTYLPGGRAGDDGRELLVVNRGGDFLLPPSPPPWARLPSFRFTVEDLLASGGREMSWNGSSLYMLAVAVPGSDLRLVLAADETGALAAIRTRLLQQLGLVLVLEVGTILLFGFLWRRVYRIFLEMERRASQQETMAALGSAAGLIAHEVKNSLNGLKAAAMLMGGRDGDMAERALRGQIDRLAHLATSLLQFGKPTSVARSEIDLRGLVREVVEGLSLLPEAEEVMVRTELPVAASVAGDPLLLATALDNLVRNAMEAAVAAKDLGKVREPEVRVSVGVEAGEAVLSVEDNAGGPPPGFEERLFTPFATSKPRGVGLGLAMSRRAVEDHGGRIEFLRIPGGSRFTVRLPGAFVAARSA